MDVPNRVVNIQNGSRAAIKGEIEFRNVKFTYPERTASCFEDLSFKIQAHQKAAFAGPSGTGKSTIFSLLYRFYDPDQGQILIDGLDIKQYDLGHLRQSLGMVGQEPVLFNSTIEYNIKYNRPEFSREQVVQSATVANALKFIESDNERAGGESDADGKGFERKVGLKGSRLSGGQKQRVAIARTVIREPIIYMFDEATSALDTESEKTVQEAINGISRNKTSLTIAHRISTIRDSDVIFVIEHGRVVEEGSYQKLMEAEGLFFTINKVH